MTTKELCYYDNIQDVDIEENLTVEELRNLEINTLKAISRRECKDNNINVSFIAFNELRGMGFKNDVSTAFLSMLVEDLYHERKVHDESDYFRLEKKDNKHYTNIAEQVIIWNESICKTMIDKAINESQCEIKDINDFVYGVVGLVSKRIDNSKKFILEA